MSIMQRPIVSFSTVCSLILTNVVLFLHICADTYVYDDLSIDT